MTNNERMEEAVEARDAKDYERAFRLFSALAETGSPKAKLNLATFFDLGLGIERDGRKAEQLYLEVGAMGIEEEHLSSLAYHNLSVLYFTGAPGLNPDREKAEKYHVKARELGFEM